jgi:uncharacterized membrane protein
MYPAAHMDMSVMAVATVLWWIVSVGAVVGVISLVVAFLRSDREARRFLEERLARGEIDIEDYRARVAVIDGVPVGH